MDPEYLIPQYFVDYIHYQYYFLEELNLEADNYCYNLVIEYRYNYNLVIEIQYNYYLIIEAGYNFY